jgi:hypothetical protein
VSLEGHKGPQAAHAAFGSFIGHGVVPARQKAKERQLGARIFWASDSHQMRMSAEYNTKKTPEKASCGNHSDPARVKDKSGYSAL